ncbi:MAG: alpha/beta hydrolase [Gammaproteobacteria bacterium]
MKYRSSFLFFIALLLSVNGWAKTESYGYPFVDPYVATVIGTPRDQQAEPAALRGGHVKRFQLQVFEDRVKPDIFWYDKGLRTAVAYQKHKAPLIFLIAGTGASFDSPKNRGLARAFYKAGFHVAAISSSTHPNFIISASTSRLPGHLMDDSRDMYRVMEQLMAKVAGDIEVSDFYITGYSLGGAQAAFLSKLDEEKRAFNFKKVLMINPPVSLYNSVMKLDGMLKNIPGGVDNFQAFLDRLMDAFTEVYTTKDNVEFNDEFLYTVYQHRPPKSDDPLAALIGTSFRISSANMVFTSDLMTNAGYIVPKNRVLSRSDSLADYAKVANRITFLQYFDELLYPYYQSKQPGLQRQALLDQLSLRSIEDYLRRSEKIYVVHNADDLILAPGEIDFFPEVFGSRARIYPTGGHCGNIDYQQNVDYMLKLFSE